MTDGNEARGPRALSAAEIEAVSGGGVLIADSALLSNGVMLRGGVLLSDGVAPGDAHTPG